MKIRDSWKLYKSALEEVKRLQAEEEKKKRFLEKKIDYVFLEEIVQKINENPLLRVRITLKDGSTLDLNTRPEKDHSKEFVVPEEEYLEVT